MTLPEGLPGENTGITFVNWSRHPWQMWALSSMMLWAITVVIDPNAYFQQQEINDLNSPYTMNLVAMGMIIGSCISLFGLHMRDREFGVWSELSGYAILLFSQVAYMISAIVYTGLLNSFSREANAVALSYVLAMLQRSYQIISYQHSRAKVARIEKKIITEASKLTKDA
jgi:hypothetical protein